MKANKKTSQLAADNLRILAAGMVEKAKSGHPGGPMGGVDFIHVLYSEFMDYDPSDMAWPMRDRFYLDAGHMSPMLYGILHLMGHYQTSDLEAFRQWGSCTPGHPELDIQRGVENTSGPLGLGHAFGIGSALAERFLHARFGEPVAHKTYIYISDGGIQEEISQGAGRLAGHLGLGQIIMFYDANDIQLSTTVEEVTGENTAMKYESWGWHVTTIDGNDHDAIRKAIKEGIKETGRPTLIIGKTVMGKGVRLEDGSSYEGEVELHGQPLGKSAASFEATIQGLGGDPAHPFRVFPDVADFYAKVIEEKKAKAQKRKEAYQIWTQENPQAAAQLEQFLSGVLPKIKWKEIQHPPNQATRSASANVMSYLAGKVENLVISSADLSNSDKTEAYLKKTGAFRRGDFSGNFLQAGVAELTMAAVMTGMGLHGGVIPACATFFTFSDYMKPAIRVAALMEQPIIFIWTHDAFRVGEDGPTHQPVEQEAQIRLLEKLKNHSGHNSFLALRPADSEETTIAWKLALENKDSPSGLILSRQDVRDLRPIKSKRHYEARVAKKGAYLVWDCQGEPDVILIANGSEVATLTAGAKLLNEHKIKVKVVSVPSEGLFRSQTASYQEKLLPAGIPKWGLTAGLPVTLEGLTGADGEVYGLGHFGYSAPYTVLDEQFGFTDKNVYKMVRAFLKKKQAD